MIDTRIADGTGLWQVTDNTVGAEVLDRIETML
jgi:hypothetical protein